MTVESNVWHIGETKSPLPPLVPGLPIIGNGLSLANEPVRFLTSLYEKYGPVFRICVFHQIVTVMAGLEVNKFAAQQGKHVFTNHDVFFDLVSALGTSKNMANLEGDNHKFFRATAHNGYSRATMAASMPHVVDVITDFLATKEIGSNFDVFPTFQR